MKLITPLRQIEFNGHLQQISQEVALVSYAVHGSTDLRAHERILSNTEFADLSNDQRHPAMGMITCLNDCFVIRNECRPLTGSDAPAGLSWSRGRFRPNRHD